MNMNNKLSSNIDKKRSKQMIVYLEVIQSRVAMREVASSDVRRLSAPDEIVLAEDEVVWER